jgi:predicted nucleic acid-binding protein
MKGGELELDTNIVIYAYSTTDSNKQKTAKQLIMTGNTIFLACDIAKRYGFSFYDSLIIAAVLENNCTILYSEDLQHNQVIEQRLRIINPFCLI